MTLENLKKHHAHLKWLASGEFTERDFDYKIEASDNPNGMKGEAGRMAMGDMSSERKRLIQQDAQRALGIFESKYPKLVFKEGEKPEEEEEKPKSKEKK